jgi:hypothetical protein
LFFVGSTSVMVAEAKRVVSVLETATRVTEVDVGKEVGAVYVQVVVVQGVDVPGAAVSMPHPGLQEAEPLLMVVACVTSQVTPPVSLTEAEKGQCSGGMLPEPAAIVAVAGVTADTRMPESSVMVAVPLFLEFATDVAVKVSGAAGVVDPAAGTSALGMVVGAV